MDSGKRFEIEDDYDKSITLNWRFSIPNEFSSKIYDFRTEVYFIGKLFEEIIKENKLENFAYSRILNEMINVDYNNRIESFFNVSRKIVSDSSEAIEFSQEEKETYKWFAMQLETVFSKISNDAEYNSNIDTITMGLESVYRNSILEDIIQSPNKLASCFVKGEYFYNKKAVVYVDKLRDFLSMMRSVSQDKKKIILNNLWLRLDKINKYTKTTEADLPF